MTEKIEIWLGYGSSEDQGAKVREAFQGAGIPIEIRYESAYPGIGNGAGFTIFVGVFGFTLGSFIKGFLEAAGADAWAKTKTLLRDLKEEHLRRYLSARPESERVLVIKDPKRRAQVNLSSDLPEEAWSKFSELEIGERENVAWVWDDSRQDWMPLNLSDAEDTSPLGPDHPDAK